MTNLKNFNIYFDNVNKENQIKINKLFQSEAPKVLLGQVSKKEIDFIFSSSKKIKHLNDDQIYIFICEELNEEDEPSVFSGGFDDYIELSRITPRGFRRMFATNFFRKVNEFENKKIQEHINRTSKLSALGLLAGGVAHELNNPLTALKGYIFRLRKTVEKNDKEDNILLKMDGIIDRMTRVVLGIRNFSRNDETDSSELVEPVLVFNYIAAFMEPILTSRGIKLLIHDSLGEDFRCWMDRSKFEGMFQNLISNAADAIGENGEIKVVFNKDGNQKFCISIQDSGSGMSLRVQEKLFDPFYTTKEIGKGTGLGMGIVLDAVNTHKGEISVKSKEGVGSKFIITFPMERRPNPLVPIRPIEKVAQGKIALIDDDKFIGDCIIEGLGEDFEIEYFSNSLEFSKRNNFDEFSLIITDLTMPNVDGFDLARIIKNSNPKVPVWLLTGNRKINRLKNVIFTSKFLKISIEPPDLLT